MAETAGLEKKTTMIRLPQSLYNTIAKRARQRMRSVNNEMVVLLKMGLVNEMDEEIALKMAEEPIDRATGTATRIVKGARANTDSQRRASD